MSSSPDLRGGSLLSRRRAPAAAAQQNLRTSCCSWIGILQLRDPSHDYILSNDERRRSSTPTVQWHPSSRGGAACCRAAAPLNDDARPPARPPSGRRASRSRVWRAVDCRRLSSALVLRRLCYALLDKVGNDESLGCGLQYGRKGNGKSRKDAESEAFKSTTMNRGGNLILTNTDQTDDRCRHRSLSTPAEAAEATHC